MKLIHPGICKGMNVGVVLANGTGTRFRSDLPKQFHMLGGR